MELAPLNGTSLGVFVIAVTRIKLVLLIGKASLSGLDAVFKTFNIEGRDLCVTEELASGGAVGVV